MRIASTGAVGLAGVLVAVLASSGCGNDKSYQHPPLDGRVDAVTPDAPLYYQPPKVLPNWDIQLRGPFDFTQPRDLVIVDLFTVVPSAQMMGDVSVPAGANPGAIAALHTAGAKVMCAVGVGAIRLSDPDAPRFPGFAAMPPDRPTAPAAGSVIGWTLGGVDADERYLDLNQSATWLPRIEARITLAKTIGCDGVLASRANYSGADTGWSNDAAGALQRTLYTTVEEAAHASLFAVGLQTVVGTGLDDLEDTYDFLLVERCGELLDCNQYLPFRDSPRPILSLEYSTNLDGDPSTLATVCANQSAQGFTNGLYKDVELTSAVRMTCP